MSHWHHRWYCCPQSRQSAWLFHQSSNWDSPTTSPVGGCVPPSFCLGGDTLARGGEVCRGGGSQFRRGDRHCGTLGFVCTLCCFRSVPPVSLIPVTHLYFIWLFFLWPLSMATGDEFVAVINDKKATYLSLLSMIPMKAQLASTFGVITWAVGNRLGGDLSLVCRRRT